MNTDPEWLRKMAALEDKCGGHVAAGIPPEDFLLDAALAQQARAEKAEAEAARLRAALRSSIDADAWIAALDRAAAAEAREARLRAALEAMRCGTVIVDCVRAHYQSANGEEIAMAHVRKLIAQAEAALADAPGEGEERR